MVAPLALLGISAASKVATGIVNQVTDALTSTGSSGAAAGASSKTAKARSTANDFEKMFLENSLDRLSQSSGTDGPLGENGTGGGVYRSMLMKEYAGQIQKSGGVGISDQIYNQILKLQEGSGGGA